MPTETTLETPRTVAAGIITLIAVIAMTGALEKVFTWFGWIAGLHAIGRIGYPLMFMLYGACAIVLSHHLTHHPAGIPKYLTQALLIIYAGWAVAQGAEQTISVILGAAIGLLWLHWFHRMGRKPLPTELKVEKKHRAKH